jgi:hypothetical protein
MACRQQNVSPVSWKLEIGRLEGAAVRLGYGTADSKLNRGKCKLGASVT